MSNLKKSADVVAYMSAATSLEDWERRTDAVKAANGGNYPRFWQRDIIEAGIGDRFFREGGEGITL